jgi:hypothetical protein
VIPVDDGADLVREVRVNEVGADDIAARVPQGADQRFAQMTAATRY